MVEDDESGKGAQARAKVQEIGSDVRRKFTEFESKRAVDALLSAVQAAYPRISHRYYAIKAKWFGADKLDYWDRNAPPPDKDERTITWDTARETVLDAYGDFSGELATIGSRFFQNAWIDAPVRPGKASGAFAHPTVPSAHPYLLLNYQGKTRDVMTLAHELGHRVDPAAAHGLDEQHGEQHEGLHEGVEGGLVLLVLVEALLDLLGRHVRESSSHLIFLVLDIRRGSTLAHRCLNLEC